MASGWSGRIRRGHENQTNRLLRGKKKNQKKADVSLTRLCVSNTLHTNIKRKMPLRDEFEIFFFLKISWPVCLFRLREKWDSNKNVTEELNCWSRSSSSYLLVFVGFSKSIGNKKKKVIRSHTHIRIDWGAEITKKGKNIYANRPTHTKRISYFIFIYLLLKNPPEIIATITGLDFIDRVWLSGSTWISLHHLLLGADDGDQSSFLTTRQSPSKDYGKTKRTNV
jgi:hypothetical protein